ncbi:lipopolysaccharide biosynthesis protein [Geodermatophilus sp. YIM 151500]|uniref:lipopolysaccharide biosynthesis protein n=1 Tax=Geodermatophilus sp. YIM 151500 TaxID=2984531 RepID=UPI0021E4EC56|nr:lipopolysaccharide biosynthesis protein [Geodermatophilus sp. YIM 151500]MCV2491116.1 lipopolysaccharide biosynthesis protein [Geodermatophilus sp. YIM 151500]
MSRVPGGPPAATGPGLSPPSAPDLSAPDQAPPSLTRQAFRGLSWSFLGALGEAALQFTAIVVLSRLVTVEEFGIAAAATVVTGFAVMLSQLGLGAAVVQARRLEHGDLAAVFVIGTGIGLLLAVVMFSVAPFVGPVVGLPADAPYLRMLSVVLVLGAARIVATGVLQRQMRFKAIALVDLVSYALGYLGTATVLALLGFGAVSLVWGQIVQATVATVVSYALVRHPVRPRRLSTMVTSARRLFGFGSAYSLSQLGNWVANNGDNFVVTSLLGPASLGVYARAHQLLVHPANLIGSVADKVLFPAMSRIQDDAARLTRAYVTANSLVAMVTVPASVLLFVLAPEVVAILLGAGWEAVALPLQVFAVVLLPRTAYKISGSLTRATGAVLGGAWRQWVYAGLVVAGCAVGSRWGIDGVAVGASVAIVVHTAVMLKFSARLRRGLVGMVLRAYAKSLPLGVGVAAVAWPLAAWLRETTSAVVTLLPTAAAGAVAAALVLLLTRRLFRDELATLQRGRRGRSPAAAAASTAP